MCSPYVAHVRSPIKYHDTQPRHRAVTITRDRTTKCVYIKCKCLWWFWFQSPCVDSMLSTRTCMILMSKNLITIVLNHFFDFILLFSLVSSLFFLRFLFLLLVSQIESHWVISWFLSGKPVTTTRVIRNFVWFLPCCIEICDKPTKTGQKFLHAKKFMLWKDMLIYWSRISNIRGERKKD